MWRDHILRNAWMPLVTATGMHIGELLGGALVIETIFAWPGVGRFAVSAVLNRDFPVMQWFHPAADYVAGAVQPGGGHLLRVARPAHSSFGGDGMSTLTATVPVKKHGLRVGYVLVGVLLILALFGPWLAPHDATLVNLDDRLLPASASHWLGTDHLGRDVLSRLMVGTQWSLGSVVLVLGLVLVMGVTIGGIAGVVGGKVDPFLMRLCDMFLTFPTLVLAFFLIALLGTGLTNVIIAIALKNA